MYLLFSSPNLSGRILDVYLYTWRGPSVNLECRSEMCCSRLAANIGHKSRQKLPSGHHRTTLTGYISQLRHVSTIGKKLVKQQYLLHMSLQCGYKLMLKVNKQKNSDTENLIYNQHGERLAILNRKYNFWMNNKEAMKKIVFFQICRTFEFLVSQGSVTTCLR